MSKPKLLTIYRGPGKRKLFELPPEPPKRRALSDDDEMRKPPPVPGGQRTRSLMDLKNSAQFINLNLPDDLPPGVGSSRVPKVVNEPLFKDDLFPDDVEMQPNVRKPQFSLNLSGYLDIVESCYSSSVLDTQFDESMLLSAYTYYCVMLLWQRLLEVVDMQVTTNLSHPLRILRKELEELKMSVPTPIAAYLSSIGSFEFSNGERLDYVTQVFNYLEEVNNIPGWYGRVSEDTHNYYEELPSPAVCIHALQVDLNDDIPIGDYHMPEEITPEVQGHGFPTPNFLGYTRKRVNSTNAKNLFRRLGFGAHEVPQSVSRDLPVYPELLKHVSNLIASGRVDNEERHPNTETGNVMQVATQFVPYESLNDLGVLERYAQLDAEVFSSTNLTARETSAAAIFGFGLEKSEFKVRREKAREALRPNGQVDLGHERLHDPGADAFEHRLLYRDGGEYVNFNPWCCYRFTGYMDVPATWVANRNALRHRDCMVFFRQHRFRSVAFKAFGRRVAWVRAHVHNR